MSLEAVASEKAENKSAARPEDTAYLFQAGARIAPEIQGVNCERPVKTRVVERNRSAVSVEKFYAALGDRAAVSANRHFQHRFGHVDAADAARDYNMSEALDRAAVAKTNFQHLVGWRGTKQPNRLFVQTGCFMRHDARDDAPQET
jgi:hypothetical protein